MKVLIVRPFPSMLDVRQNTYNIQEIGLAKALNRRGCQTDLLFWTDGEEAEITIPVEGGRIGAGLLQEGIQQTEKCVVSEI